MTLGEAISDHLPYLRRFASNLLDSLTTGDVFVRSMLQRMLTEGHTLDPEKNNIRLELYETFIKVISDAVSSQDVSLIDLVPSITFLRQRAAPMLVTLESFTYTEASRILGVPLHQVRELVENKNRHASEAAHVLIVENEPLIQMHLEEIVKSLGHKVLGVTDDYESARRIIETSAVDVALVDIQLSGSSTGIDLVRDLYGRFNFTPIFVTAYPERLLTSGLPEPTYLITKPYDEAVLRGAISQALARKGPASAPKRGTETPILSPKGQFLEESAGISFSAKQKPSVVTTTVEAGVIVKSSGKSRAISSIENNLESISGVLNRSAEATLNLISQSNSARFFAPYLQMILELTEVPDYDDSSAIELGLIADMLISQLEFNSELMQPESAGIRSVVALAKRIALQFPGYLDFSDASQRSDEITASSRNAVELAAEEIYKIPSQLVADDVVSDTKLSIELLEANPEDRLTFNNARNAIENVFTSAIKLVLETFKDVKKETKSQAVEKLSGIILGLPVVAATYIFSPSLTAEIAFFTAIVISRNKSSSDKGE